MAETKKAEERRKKREQSGSERERKAPSTKEKASQAYRFDDWASI